MRELCSYVLPLRRRDGRGRSGLTSYLRDLSEMCAEVIVVDGSDRDIFDANAAAWQAHVRHLAPRSPEAFLNGKVAGVLTALDEAIHEQIVIADDDVRYDGAALRAVLQALTTADLVRPQNYFSPLPWHARWDTARTLLNRAVGGDFPGTLAVRRSLLRSIGGYDGDVLFENLELMRTVEAHGGRIANRPDLYVRRLPPSSAQFLAQRVRQAYDDFACPARMTMWLTLVPISAACAFSRRRGAIGAAAVASVAVAEYGRRRLDGSGRFPASASWLAPLWLLERGVCAWLALAARLVHGGVRYHGRRIKVSAHSMATLRRAAQQAEPVAAQEMQPPGTPDATAA
jgi:hypothetical protein